MFFHQCGLITRFLWSLFVSNCCFWSFKVDGGSILSVKISWSQKLEYKDGQFSLNVPFSFPDYVTPVVKKMSKKEKIQLNVNAGTGSEVLCKTISHPLKVQNLISIFVLVLCELAILIEC